VPPPFTLWLPDDRPLRYGGLEVTFPTSTHPRLIKHGEAWIPETFRVSVDRPELPQLVLDVDRVSGQFRCTRLEVLPKPPRDHVEPAALRRIRIPQLVREALDLVTFVEDKLPDQESVEFIRALIEEFAESVPAHLDTIAVGDKFRYPAISPLITGEPDAYEHGYREYARELRSLKWRRRSGYITDEQVASEYRRAFELNESVTSAVADAFGWKEQTAANRIRQAMAAGFLPATVQGQARV
jgi:hypothetical protein